MKTKGNVSIPSELARYTDIMTGTLDNIPLGCFAASSQTLYLSYIELSCEMPYGTSYGQGYEIRGNVMKKADRPASGPGRRPLIAYLTDEFMPRLLFKLLWFDSTGHGWSTQITAKTKEAGVNTRRITEISDIVWQPVKGYLPAAPKDMGTSLDWQCIYNVLNSEEEMNMILLSKDPGAYKFSKEKKQDNGLFSAATLLMAPQIKILNEHQCLCITRNDGSDILGNDDYAALARFTRSGSTLDEVLDIPKDLRRPFLESWSLEDWFYVYEQYRKGEK